MQIFANTLDEEDITLDVEGSDVVGDVKAQIQEQYGRVKVYVEILHDIVIATSVEDSDTFDNVKAKIHDKEGIPPEEQRVMFDAFFGQFGLTLVVAMMSGQTIAVDVGVSHTIDHVKAKIQDNEGIPSNQQSLIFSGTLLESDRPLSAYNIPNEATVQLVTSDR